MKRQQHPLHIKNTELHKSTKVQNAVEKKERLSGKRVPNDPSSRIEAYMDRLEKIFLNPNKYVRRRNLEMLRDKIYNTLLIKRENFPESYFELQKRINRERGEAMGKIPEDVRERMKDTAIKNQKASLDAWMEYLTSDDAVYPAWFKYLVWKNVIKLSQFDKERGEFKKRSNSTVAPFPEIYYEPLAQIADIYEKIKENNENLSKKEIKESFFKKFPKLYAELVQKFLAARMESKEEVRGEWVKYKQGKDGEAERLFQSLEGKGTGWCTAGRFTAKNQIEIGDFYVYYTYDQNGNPTQPRLAIRMKGNKIVEVRGVSSGQNIEPSMQEILDKKLSEFGAEAEAYKKKSADMKRLNEIEKKVKSGKNLDKDDLVFLYEIDSPIEEFGNQKDHRVQELRSKRNMDEDIIVIFGCTRDQIAHAPNEIAKNTKIYIGYLEPGIFERIPKGIEHIYTSFPEKKIRKENIEIGGKTAEQLISDMESAGIKTSNYIKQILQSREFTPSNREEITLIILTVDELGFTGKVTIEQIYERAQNLGLKLCPLDTGPHYRLKYQDQPLGEWLYISTKQIKISEGEPSVFLVGHSKTGLLFDISWADEDNKWNLNRKFVFHKT